MGSRPVVSGGWNGDWCDKGGREKVPGSTVGRVGFRIRNANFEKWLIMQFLIISGSNSNKIL